MESKLSKVESRRSKVEAGCDGTEAETQLGSNAAMFRLGNHESEEAASLPDSYALLVPLNKERCTEQLPEYWRFPYPKQAITIKSSASGSGPD